MPRPRRRPPGTARRQSRAPSDPAPGAAGAGAPTGRWAWPAGSARTRPSGGRSACSPYRHEPVKVENGRGYAECELSLKGTDEVVVQVDVKKTAWPGNSVANGSVRLHWTDASQTTIATSQTDGSLYDCKITEDGGAKVTITLV
ncbi:hypothetical protein ACFYS8_17520 [Kitasatospora sp. NPDC004615]|uniref:hypothetical protein n=1 Tax=Kitasatospora sp. NPDC004615 TaxID=3364017 RepID=UPI003695859E